MRGSNGPPGRRRILTTTHGANLHAFSPTDWARFLSIGAITRNIRFCNTTISF